MTFFSSGTSVLCSPRLAAYRLVRTVVARVLAVVLMVTICVQALIVVVDVVVISFAWQHVRVRGFLNEPARTLWTLRVCRARLRGAARVLNRLAIIAKR